MTIPDWLRLLPPEQAHAAALRLMRFAPRGNERTRTNPMLMQKLCGLTFANPVGPAAGFDKDAAAGLHLFRLGFGFVELGTVTPLAQAGNPRPRLFRLSQDRAIVNRMGFNSKGVEAMAARLQKITKCKTSSQIIGVNIGKNKTGDVEDYLTCLKKIAGFADYVAINISSPNTPGLRDLQKPETIKRLLGALKNHLAERNLACPIFLKLSPDIDAADIKPLARAAMAADGLILTNTSISRPALESRHAAESGGLSGAPLFALATDRLRRFANETGGALPLIGVGGIHDADTAYKKIRAGASLLQLYTGLIYGHHRLVTEILQGLEDRLKTDGFRHIGEAVAQDV